ncbi:uncharacterized protein HKW66_Vig0257350 [Vigna angularis]|uniref:Uncharacterized protein n=1 Tax=Phaseolus angularis TaxID=3914 RepID=A0A8T0JTM7_PHAAN|nr:uncharacterized protein HKW66_Vig0257350 [Vigna angularis]
MNVHPRRTVVVVSPRLIEFCSRHSDYICAWIGALVPLHQAEHKPHHFSFQHVLVLPTLTPIATPIEYRKIQDHL